MRQAPNLWNPKSFFAFADEHNRQTKGGNWVPARPLGRYSIVSRIKLAWNVFLGRYDAMRWPSDDEWDAEADRYGKT